MVSQEAARGRVRDARNAAEDDARALATRGETTAARERAR